MAKRTKRTRTTTGKKKSVKSILKNVAIVLAFVFVIGAVVALAVKLDRQTTTTRLGTETYKIGTITAEGETTDANTSIYTSKAITTDGLKCDLKDEAKIVYQIFFYDKEDKFISATETLTVDYEGDAIPEGATRARIMITPTEDSDGSVSAFEKAGYAEQLTVIVNR